MHYRDTPTCSLYNTELLLTVCTDSKQALLSPISNMDCVNVFPKKLVWPGLENKTQVHEVWVNPALKRCSQKLTLTA